MAPDPLAEDELERLADARRAGATLMAVTTGGTSSPASHTSPRSSTPPDLSGLEDVGFASHVVTVSAGTALRPRRRFALLSR